MTDLFSIGSTWLETQRLSHLVQTVDYVAGDTTYSSISATRSLTRVKGLDAYGRVIYIVLFDFLVKASSIITPASGHRITDGTQTFEVLAMGETGRCWEWSDYNKLVYRIHTKEII
jgi:hypothetical protein